MQRLSMWVRQTASQATRDIANSITTVSEHLLYTVLEQYGGVWHKSGWLLYTRYIRHPNIMRPSWRWRGGQTSGLSSVVKRSLQVPEVTCSNTGKFYNKCCLVKISCRVKISHWDSKDTFLGIASLRNWAVQKGWANYTISDFMYNFELKIKINFFRFRIF